MPGHSTSALRRLRKLVCDAGHPPVTAFARRRRGWPGHPARRRASRFYPAMTTSQTSPQHPWGAALRRERSLGLFSDRLERRRLVDGEIRQHLAVNGDARLGEAVDKKDRKSV